MAIPEMRPMPISGRMNWTPVARQSPNEAGRPARSLTVPWITAPCSTELAMTEMSTEPRPMPMFSGVKISTGEVGSVLTSAVSATATVGAPTSSSASRTKTPRLRPSTPNSRDITRPMSNWPCVGMVDMRRSPRARAWARAKP